ncbi:uncharacterized protein LOC127846536 isoform X2 [Dreissena polymorpha]|uniref:uncharacterized protein LOC127846536 isoform X2 n=1 Tax=Dreissena polymorpha TaxID=45954 RepID=UPI002264E29C|nr:uncharacterized protein LOC127846536 isoform X2 [Dreissena polymorpha]
MPMCGRHRGYSCGLKMICGGICSLYVFMTEAPLLDYYYLDLPSAVKIKRAVTGNTVTSVLSLIGCVAGLLVCVVFAVGPCDTDMWFSKCSYTENKTEHRLLAIFITIFLCSCTILSVYSSIMSCVHGWVFDFGACAVEMRRLESHENKTESRPASSFQPAFQPVPMFDADENGSRSDDEMKISSKYTATSSFKQHNDHNNDRNWDGNHDDGHVAARKQHIQATQPQCYIAVLNDPAMKQKLKERNSRLQEQ